MGTIIFKLDDDLDQQMRQTVYTKGYIKGDLADFLNMAVELYLERLKVLDLLHAVDRGVEDDK